MNGYTPESLAGLRASLDTLGAGRSSDSEVGQADQVVMVVTDERASDSPPDAGAAPVAMAPSVGASQGGVGTLRAILLGEAAPDEQRRVAALERRLDALAAQLDEVTVATRSSDVVVGSLAALQQQIDALRHEQELQTTITAERLRQSDDRCRMRQRRVRATSHLELRRLRQRIYAAADLPSARHRPGAPRSAVGQHADDRPLWPFEDGAGSELADRGVRAGGTVAPATAWLAVWDATVVWWRAFAVLWVALFHAAGEDARAAADHIRDMFRR